MRYLIKGILHRVDEPDLDFSWAVNSEEEKDKALAERLGLLCWNFM